MEKKSARVMKGKKHNFFIQIPSIYEMEIIELNRDYAPQSREKDTSLTNACFL